MSARPRAAERSIRGFKTRYRIDRETATREVDAIIKNTYRTLMTRGQKGCYVFCTDEETRDHFRARLTPER